MPRAHARSADLSPAKREQILEGARQAFTEHGYERASVDLVAARAGVSKATVYNHFEDKRALFTAALLDVTAQVRRRNPDRTKGRDGGLRSIFQTRNIVEHLDKDFGQGIAFNACLLRNLRHRLKRGNGNPDRPRLL